MTSPEYVVRPDDFERPATSAERAAHARLAARGVVLDALDDNEIDALVTAEVERAAWERAAGVGA